MPFGVLLYDTKWKAVFEGICKTSILFFNWGEVHEVNPSNFFSFFGINIRYLYNMGGKSSIERERFFTRFCQLRSRFSPNRSTFTVECD